MKMAEDGQRSHEYIPIASTSAVRLNSPFPSPFPPPSTSERVEDTIETPPPISVDDRDLNLAELPSILKRLTSLSLKHPDQSPSDIISRARAKAFDQDHNQPPPTPPPPIVLHPQPYSSNSQFFTPLLLQAMILGASALGLLTRRKVRLAESKGMDDRRKRNKTAKEEAEDKIDEVQALNLLISAHAVPEVQDPEQSAGIEWRNEMMKPLIRLVTQAVQSDQPLNRLGIASILDFIQPSLPQYPLYNHSRPLLASQAFEAFKALPSTLDSSNSDFPLEAYTLSSLLSLIYPQAQGSNPKFFASSSSSGSRLDRSILEAVASRTLSSPSDHPAELFLELGQAAARAKRFDIFKDTIEHVDSLSPSLRIDLAVTGLDLVASQKQSRSDRDEVLPLAEMFTKAVGEMRTLDKGGIDRLDRGIYLLRTAFSIDRPLEPFIARSLLATLSSPFLFDSKKYRTLVVDVLKHLSKSRNPSLARQILSSIPSDLLRLPYLLPLLSSSHPPTSQSTWDLLISHPSFPLSSQAVSARFTSLSHRSAPPSTLDIARRDFRLVRERGILPTIEIWNKFLLVVVRFGGDRAVENVLSSMRRAGIEENEWTRDILLQREMIRQDEQVRKVRERTRQGDPVSERPDSREEMTVRLKRRGGGQAQMRALKKAIRARAEEDGSQHRNGGGGAQKVDITPNLLLKNVTRWTRECDTPRLVQLAKVVLNIDLSFTDSPALSSSASTVSASTRAMSKEEYDRLRVPAFKTLISAFERRGRKDFASELRRKFKEERNERGMR
ncbi:uncharacterized protein JCM6883_001683 [Sporobolomyces salmoneus]|uniref:uncharacterized protein n=1 Tax=Sporobolomyces salmoneus TaxID=183962 RepID=UPI0031735A78